MFNKVIHVVGKYFTHPPGGIPQSETRSPPQYNKPFYFFHFTKVELNLSLRLSLLKGEFFKTAQFKQRL